MTHAELVQRINVLRPGATFVCVGNSYAGIDWQDKIQSKPTIEELGL